MALASTALQVGSDTDPPHGVSETAPMRDATTPSPSPTHTTNCWEKVLGPALSPWHRRTWTSSSYSSTREA